MAKHINEKLETCDFHKTFKFRFILNAKGVDLHRVEDKVEAVTTWAQPKNVKKLLEFCQKCIKDLSEGLVL